MLELLISTCNQIPDTHKRERRAKGLNSPRSKSTYINLIFMYSCLQEPEAIRLLLIRQMYFSLTRGTCSGCCQNWKPLARPALRCLSAAAARPPNTKLNVIFAEAMELLSSHNHHTFNNLKKLPNKAALIPSAADLRRSLALQVRTYLLVYLTTCRQVDTVHGHCSYPLLHPILVLASL